MEKNGFRTSNRFIAAYQMQEFIRPLYGYGRIKQGLDYLKSGKTVDELKTKFGKFAERIIRLKDKLDTKLATIVLKTPEELGFIKDGKLTTKGEMEVNTTGRYYGLTAARLLTNKPLFCRKDKVQCNDLGLELAGRLTQPMAEAIRGNNIVQNIRQSIKVLKSFILKRENLQALKDDYDEMEYRNIELFPVVDKGLASKAGILYGIYDMATEAVKEEELFGDSSDFATEFPIIDESEDKAESLLTQMIEEHIVTSSPELQRRNYILNLWKAEKVAEHINPQEFWDSMCEPIIEFFTGKKVYGSDQDYVELNKTEQEAEKERDNFPYQSTILETEYCKKEKPQVIMKDRGYDKTGKWLGRDIIKVEKRSWIPLKRPQLAIEEADFSIESAFKRAEEWKKWALKLAFSQNACGVYFVRPEDYKTSTVHFKDLLVKARYLRQNNDLPDTKSWEYKRFFQQQEDYYPPVVEVA